MKNKWLIVAGAVALTAVSTVQATPALNFQISSDGTHWTSITSGYSNPSFGGFDITSISGNLTGSPTQPIMDLDSLDISGTGTLYVEMSVTGLGPSAGGLAAHLGGNLAGSDTVNWSGYAASSDMAFDTGAGTQIFNLLGLSGPVNAFAGGPINQEGLYSLTEEYVINGTGNGQTANTDSLDGSMAVPDGGSTAAMLGLALSSLGLVFIRKVRCA